MSFFSCQMTATLFICDGWALFLVEAVGGPVGYSTEVMAVVKIFYVDMVRNCERRHLSQSDRAAAVGDVGFSAHDSQKALCPECSMFESRPCD